MNCFFRVVDNNDNGDYWWRWAWLETRINGLVSSWDQLVDGVKHTDQTDVCYLMVYLFGIVKIDDI